MNSLYASTTSTIVDENTSWSGGGVEQALGADERAPASWTPARSSSAVFASIGDAMKQELHIGKLDAARRQLETAVRLYFAEADPVSIHTLTAAAHAVLAGLNKARRGPPMLEEQMLGWVKPAMLPEAKRRLKAAANFFKHADRDPNAIYAFSPSQTEVLLFDAGETYRRLTGELVPTLAAYRIWFTRGPGAELVDPARAGVVTKLRIAFSDSRQEFFAQVLPVVTSLEK